MATLNAGTGNDGSITISGSKNLNTDILADGRSYADGVVYRINAISSDTVTTVATPLGLVQNDEVLLINLKGTSDSNYDNAGNYEFFIIDDIVGNTITFKTSKTKLYGDNGGDSNVDNHHVVIQRVPNYQEVTIQNSSELSCSAWTLSNPAGILALRVKGTLLNDGIISVLGKGFATPTDGGDYGHQGQSIGQNSAVTNSRSVGGGGGGRVAYYSCSGSSYATLGVNNAGSTPGIVYGDEALVKLFLGSAGAGAGSWGNGGAAGGIIFIAARTLNNDGSIINDGVNGTGSIGGGGTGGTGGSTRIEAGTLLLGDGTISAIGVDQSGHGRNAIYYNNTTEAVSGSPTPYIDSTLEIPPSYEISGILSEAATIRVYNYSTGQLIKAEAKEAGAYSVELTSDDKVDLLAKKSNDETLSFGGVTPSTI